MLDQAVVLCRLASSPEWLVQSIVGVAFRGGQTFLLSSSDKKVCTKVVYQHGVDLFGNSTDLHGFYCFVGGALQAMFPGVEDFEIFRLHYDRYRQRRDTDEVYGELLHHFKEFDPKGLHLDCFISLEHLWGGHFADAGLLVKALENKRWGDLMLRLQQQVALTTAQIQASDIGYVPHPGIEPVWPDLIAEEVGVAERMLRRQSRIVQVM